jgi:hypothetical protein
MYCAARWSAVALAVFCADALRADTLRLSDRGTIQGTLQELVLRVDGLPRVYNRGELKEATLADASDALELADGSKVEGRVLSLTFKCSDKLYAYGRSKVKAVELDPQSAISTPTPVVEKPTPTVAEEPPRARPRTAEELESQKKGLAKNEEFLRQFLAKAGKRGLFGSASKAEDRKKRVLAMAEQIKTELLAGRLFTDGQIYQRYEAAVAGKPFSEPTKTQLRTMAQGVKVKEGTDKNTPELLVEPFPEQKY